MHLKIALQFKDKICANEEIFEDDLGSPNHCNSLQEITL